MSEIEVAVHFWWIPARCHEAKLLEAISVHLHWITVDLPCEFSIENVISHLLAKTKGNRRGRHSQPNPCWIPAETPAYFCYMKPNYDVLATVPPAQDMSSTCNAKWFCRSSSTILAQKTITLYTISFVSWKNQKFSLSDILLAHHIQFNSILWRLHIFSGCDFWSVLKGL